MKIFGALLCAFTFIASILAENSSDDRPASLFKAGDEWLALPEVFSNLDFTADSTFAKEDDIEGQMRLRATRFWGRLYIDGWSQTIQFFRAHFGNEAPMGKKHFVFAEPRDACQDLTNAHLLTSNHVILAHRGTCTFGTKTKIAMRTNASAIIIINNEPGIDHLPGPDAHDVQFSVGSIAQQEGQLLEAVYDEGPGEDGFLGRRLEGYIVPINCEKSGAKCGPATMQERAEIANLVEGGIVRVFSSDYHEPLQDSKEHPIEYLLAHFGVKATHANSTMGIVVAKPVEACQPLENDVRGKAVLVRRGSCPFVKKAEEIQAAGGRVMVIGNQYPFIVRAGVEPRWKGLNTVIPVIMVSKRAYTLLVAESYGGARISLVEDTDEKRTINSETWEALEKLHKGEGWPRSDIYVTKKYEELKAMYETWPDRLLTLQEAYNDRVKEAAATAKKTGIKSEL